MTHRIKHTAAFKARATRAALSENTTLADLSREFKVHPVRIVIGFSKRPGSALSSTYKSPCNKSR